MENREKLIYRVHMEKLRRMQYHDSRSLLELKELSEFLVNLMEPYVDPSIGVVRSAKGTIVGSIMSLDKYSSSGKNRERDAFVSAKENLVWGIEQIFFQIE